MTNEDALTLYQEGCRGCRDRDDVCGSCEHLVAIEAIKKQIPTKPIYSDYDEEDGIYLKAVCPVCGNEFEFGEWNEDDNHHCVCGQLMDWCEAVKEKQWHNY